LIVSLANTNLVLFVKNRNGNPDVPARRHAEQEKENPSCSTKTTGNNARRNPCDGSPCADAQKNIPRFMRPGLCWLKA